MVACYFVCRSFTSSPGCPSPGMSLWLEALMSLWSLGLFEVIIAFWSLRLFSYPWISPILSLTLGFYRRGARIRIAVLLGMVTVIFREFTKVLGFVQNVYGLLFIHPNLHPIHPSFRTLFWGFISNCIQFVRGGAGDEASQPFLSFFSFKSGTSPFENV